MISKADLERAHALADELDVIKRTLINFASGGAIVHMTVSGSTTSSVNGSKPQQLPNVTILMEHMLQSREMVLAIVKTLADQEKQLADELERLSVMEIGDLVGPTLLEQEQELTLTPPGASPYRFRRVGP